MPEAKQPVIILQGSLCRLAEPLSDRLPQLSMFIRVHCFLQPEEHRQQGGLVGESEGSGLHSGLFMPAQAGLQNKGVIFRGAVISHPSHLRGLLRQGIK